MLAGTEVWGVSSGGRDLAVVVTPSFQYWRRTARGILATMGTFRLIVCSDKLWSRLEPALHHVSVSTVDSVAVVGCQAVHTLFCSVICRQLQSCAPSYVASVV